MMKNSAAVAIVPLAGRVSQGLEPAMGVGNFFGLMPESMQGGHMVVKAKIVEQTTANRLLAHHKNTLRYLLQKQ
jgi:hypothetical protein